ncbi:MAG TPA: hypothetical protein VG142_13630 [Trebonia sp.]|jgi:hypothetical protein|nr:hypothetical protein [Trebonia sp.]
MTADTGLLEPFVAFSAYVTAFSEFDLLGTGQAEAFLETVQDQAGTQTLRALLEAFGPLTGEPDDPDALASRVERDIFGSEEIGPLARSIIKLWYAGIWYEPEWARADAVRRGLPRQRTPGQEPDGEPATPGKDGREAPFVVSPAAYTEGLLWRAIGAHPSGAKAPGYGSWAMAPTIEDYAEGTLR